MLGYSYEHERFPIPEKLPGDSPTAKAVNALIDRQHRQAELTIPDDPIEPPEEPGDESASAELPGDLLMPQIQTHQPIPEDTEYPFPDDDETLPSGLPLGQQIVGDELHITIDPPPADEDFTTYAGLDNNNRFTVTSSTIAWDGLTENEDAYRYKDYTVDHFTGDFAFSIATRRRGDGTGRPLVLGLSNEIDDWKNWRDDNHQAWVISWDRDETLRLRECEADTFDESIDLTLNVWYYLYITRVGDSLTVAIYANENFTGLVDTITRTLPTGRAYRYVFAANSYNSGSGTKLATGDVKDLNLNYRSVVRHIGPDGGTVYSPTHDCTIIYAFNLVAQCLGWWRIGTQVWESPWGISDPGYPA